MVNGKYYLSRNGHVGKLRNCLLLGEPEEKLHVWLEVSCTWHNNQHRPSWIVTSVETSSQKSGVRFQRKRITYTFIIMESCDAKCPKAWWWDTLDTFALCFLEKGLVWMQLDTGSITSELKTSSATFIPPWSPGKSSHVGWQGKTKTVTRQLSSFFPTWLIFKWIRDRILHLSQVGFELTTYPSSCWSPQMLRSEACIHCAWLVLSSLTYLSTICKHLQG